MPALRSTSTLQRRDRTGASASASDSAVSCMIHSPSIADLIRA